jgi:ABC-2 type transport system permease protein
MFLEFLLFEIKFRLKSISTYVYFALFATVTFFFVAAQDFGPIGNGRLLLNGPYATAVYQLQLMLFGVIVVAAIFGTSILRDFQRDTYQLIFTKPISKFAYLGGRWAGSFLITVMVFGGILFGEWLGTHAPWADHTRIQPNHLWTYLQPFFSLVVVQIFFLGSLFFCVAALTRKIFIVYLQGVALFMVYVIGITVFSATRSLDRFWPAVLDPLGLLMFDSVTRYWTVVERNTKLLEWSGMFLWNRLLWGGVGVLSLAIVWSLFPMSVEALTAKASGRRAARARKQDEEENKPRRSLVAAALPRVQQVFGPRTTFMQLVSLTRLRVSNILHEIPFWAICGLLIAFAINNGYFAGHIADRNVWPVTYLMLQSVEGSATLFFFIVATLYAGELIWRERDTHFEGIHDALPMHEGVDWLSKLLALAWVEILLLTLTMICCIGMQTVLGYHHYEFSQYFKELYVITFPQIITFALLALFVQTLVTNKFIGHAIVIGTFIVPTILQRYGFENSLYLPGATTPYTYSDMNGYGHFAPALGWSIAYWLSWMAFLGVLAVTFVRRGSDTSFAGRLSQAKQRIPGLAALAVLFILAITATGGWFYWNAHVRNEYQNSQMRRRLQADYEKQFKKYEKLPQPKIVSVNTWVNIYPERRSFAAVGYYVLQNKTGQPISEIHVTDQMQSVDSVQFDQPFHKASQSAKNAYTIYALNSPLAPGKTLRMDFRASYSSHGFKDGGERPELARNGTFFDASYFPYIGYNNSIELDDPLRRREEKLPPLEELSPRGDPYYKDVNLFSPESDWINYHAVVSTSEDQIAISPGYLKRDWIEGGRHYYEYDMAGTKVADFFAFQSGRYAIKRDRWKNVNLEIYYTPGHEFDLNDMMASSKAGLAYYEQYFGPYQFQQYRIIEFPRYREFAQSFPNTVPYSEGIGFIQRTAKPDDIDFTYFVTAHELGHQWWGHQLIGGMVQGSNMMSETLAEYSALKVMEKKYGTENMHKFLKHELDGYLRGRAGETRKEPPLVLVQREPYVWYQKGGLVMYALDDYIGEDRVNAALKNFLTKYRYANASDLETEPYPDTRQFVAALREQTPADMQYLITDMFESIVLYDNKALNATVTQAADKKYHVTLTLQARKSRADENGNETSMPMNDYIDVGVFSGKKDHEKPLYLKKAKFTQEKQTFDIVVDEAPTRAGIDPYNKLIDRIADDNIMDITKP